MNRNLVWFFAVCGACAVVHSASAQVNLLVKLPWKYTQTWRKPWHSHESVVLDCSGAQVGFAPVAMDDWICTQTGPIYRFQWWGTSPQPNPPLNRSFYIAIYSDANCGPGQLLYQVCLVASYQLVGIDCQNQNVYRFNAAVPGGVPVFTQQAGQHYWLQISEVDAGAPTIPPSPMVGVTEFEWSPHRPVANCAALQLTQAGGVIQPLLDVCDNNQNDLAFAVSGNLTIGTLPPPPTATPFVVPRPTFVAEWRRRPDGAIAHVECFTLENDGTFYLEPELPAGNYRLGIRGMSMRPVFFDVFFEPDTPLDLGMVPVSLGDVDGDGDVDFADLTLVLVGWAP